MSDMSDSSGVGHTFSHLIASGWAWEWLRRGAVIGVDPDSWSAALGLPTPGDPVILMEVPQCSGGQRSIRRYFQSVC